MCCRSDRNFFLGFDRLWAELLVAFQCWVFASNEWANLRTNRLWCRRVYWRASSCRCKRRTPKSSRVVGLSRTRKIFICKATILLSSTDLRSIFWRNFSFLQLLQLLWILVWAFWPGYARDTARLNLYFIPRSSRFKFRVLFW